MKVANSRKLENCAEVNLCLLPSTPPHVKIFFLKGFEFKAKAFET